MEHDTDRSYIEDRSDDENSVINLLHRYITHWRWFLLSVPSAHDGETPLHRAAGARFYDWHVPAGSPIGRNPRALLL